jgi:hypothetical protein
MILMMKRITKKPLDINTTINRAEKKEKGLVF